jgi:DNA topoisomerase-1
VKCPQCKEGEIVEKKARRGNFFYGCSRYPKCDFTVAYKPVPEKCPKCGSDYLLEKNLKSGKFLSCPNNKAAAAEEPKRRGKKKAAETETAVQCDYSVKIAEPEKPADVA